MIDGRNLGLTLVLAACVAAGCGDDTDMDHAGHHDGGHAGHGDTGDAGGHHEMKTPCPPSIPDFVATPSGGLEVTGNNDRISAKLIDADSNPPYKGDNEWDVLFSDADGEPLADIEIEKAETYMTVHRHPGEKTPRPSKLDEPGVVRFETLNLFMGGPWEVRFNVASEVAGGSDYLVFHVCVPDE